MFKAICNLMTEGLSFENNRKYSEAELSKISPVLVKMCFVETEADVVAEASAETDTNAEGDVTDNNSLTVDELKQALTNLGIEIPEKVKKAELVEILNEAQK